MDFKDFFYKKHPSERDRAAIQKYQRGIPVTEIIQELGYTSVGKFYEMLKQNGFPANRLRQKHDLISYFHDGGYNSNQIASLVNMTERGVRKAINRLNEEIDPSEIEPKTAMLADKIGMEPASLQLLIDEVEKEAGKPPASMDDVKGWKIWLKRAWTVIDFTCKHILKWGKPNTLKIILIVILIAAPFGVMSAASMGHTLFWIRKLLGHKMESVSFSDWCEVKECLTIIEG